MNAVLLIGLLSGCKIALRRSRRRRLRSIVSCRATVHVASFPIFPHPGMVVPEPKCCTLSRNLLLYPNTTSHMCTGTDTPKSTNRPEKWWVFSYIGKSASNASFPSLIHGSVRTSPHIHTRLLFHLQLDADVCRFKHHHMLLITKETRHASHILSSW